jgi:glycosyltransferase involved in cell wall biosynthesis
LKISLIIPCYNSELTINRCIESALSQSLAFFEIIIVDNNSTDKTLMIAKSFEKIKVLKCSIQGASASRNVGWREATGDYIAFIDDDVVLSKTWHFHILKLLDDKSIVAAQSKIIPTSKANDNKWIHKYRIDRKYKKTNSTWIELDLANNITAINTAACVYKKDILIKLNGFEESLFRLEDTDLAIKARYLGQLASCDKAIAHVYFSGNTISYLLRSFKDGRAQAWFNALWCFSGKNCVFEFVSIDYKAFEFLNFIMFKLGYIYETLKLKKIAPRSIKMVELIKKLKLNS